MAYISFTFVSLVVAVISFFLYPFQWQFTNWLLFLHLNHLPLRFYYALCAVYLYLFYWFIFYVCDCMIDGVFFTFLFLGYYPPIRLLQNDWKIYDSIYWICGLHQFDNMYNCIINHQYNIIHIIIIPFSQNPKSKLKYPFIMLHCA